MSQLKLIALDAEDLEVIAAYTQDAVMRVADMGLSEADSRFACLMNRFAWEDSDDRGKGERRRAALHFDRVRAVDSRGIDLNAREGVLDLLTLRFEPGEDPAGTVVLEFAGGGTVELKVECLEVRMQDLGAAWAARGRPVHDLDEDPGN